MTKQDASIGYQYSIEKGFDILKHLAGTDQDHDQQSHGDEGTANENRQQEIEGIISKYKEQFRQERSKATSDSQLMRIAERYDEIFTELENTSAYQKLSPNHKQILYHGTDIDSAKNILKEGIRVDINKGEAAGIGWATSDKQLASEYAKEVGEGGNAIVVISDYKRAGFNKGGSDPKDYHNYANTPVDHIKEIRIYKDEKEEIIINPKWGGLKGKK